MSLKTVDTPCIGICSTVYGDEVCLGCKRHYLEIIEWNSYDAGKKCSILRRLENDIVAVMRDEVEIVDVRRLQQQLDHLHIRYWPAQNPLCWAYYLLRAEHQNINDVSKYGVKLAGSSTSYNLHELYRAIEIKLLKLAQQST